MKELGYLNKFAVKKILHEKPGMPLFAHILLCLMLPQLSFIRIGIYTHWRGPAWIIALAITISLLMVYIAFYAALILGII